MVDLHFIITICFFLLSVTAAFLLMLFNKTIHSKIHIFIIWTHLLSLMISIFHILLPGFFNDYIFLCTICTGLLTGGVILRNNYSLYLKIYAAIYFISIPCFIVSPSKTISVISGKLPSGEVMEKIKVTGNIYLVSSRNDNRVTAVKAYKVIKDFGMFYKTLARNIPFYDKVDSAQLHGDSIIIYGRSQIKTFNLKAYPPTFKSNKITKGKEHD